MSYPSVSFRDQDFKTNLIKAYTEYGMCVITDVVPKDECYSIIDKIVDGFERLGTGINRNDTSTWNEKNTPPQTRTGMYQSIVCNLPVIWETKVKSEIVTIFETLYQTLKPDASTDLIVSNDGLNIKPGSLPPFHEESIEKDWAHLDQTESNDPYYCIQGQLVLNGDTTSVFRCTPRSHLYHEEILEDYGKNGQKGNWFMLTNNQKYELKKKLEDRGCEWQIPIYAPTGSFIVWGSSVIHSAKFADKPVYPDPKDENPWNGWRCVLYICYRPRSDMDESDIAKKIPAIKQNRVMNHWGTKTFPIVTGSRHNHDIKRHSKINYLIEDPSRLWKVLKVDPPLTERVIKYIS